jgi:hypothetical protein
MCLCVCACMREARARACGRDAHARRGGDIHTLDGNVECVLYMHDI